jgi:hypothetical protein
MIIANIVPSRSHSSGVNAARSRDHDVHCLLSGSAAMSRPIWKTTPTVDESRPPVNLMRTIRRNSANFLQVGATPLKALELLLYTVRPVPLT